jgi:predicted RND superfamily exporter protein
VLLLNAIQEELVRTQVKSFAMALLSIMVILALVFKSAAIVGIGTAVNVFPITVLVGAAALSGIPLNVATIMIAAVAVGIAVDDTVFFLTRLHSEAGHASGAEGAIDATLIHMAGPITCTTLVVSIGFFVLIPADFTPIRHFGMLGGLTMISAWIGDIVLLPALLYAFHRPTKGTPCEPR